MRASIHIAVDAAGGIEIVVTHADPAMQTVIDRLPESRDAGALDLVAAIAVCSATRIRRDLSQIGYQCEEIPHAVHH